MSLGAVAMETISMNDLITKACGARSLTEFAKSCGISTMHVSRIKSGVVKPSRKMCVKLGSDSYVKQIGMSSADFMRAAGYEDETEIVSTANFEQILNESLEFLAAGFIAKKLLSKGITFTQTPSFSKPDVDITFEIMDEDIKEWNICTGSIANLQVKDLDKVSKYYLMGRLVTFEPQDQVQYTLVVNNEEMYQWICSCAEGVDIRANVTLVLLDHKQMTIAKEAVLGPGDTTYLSLLDD